MMLKKISGIATNVLGVFLGLGLVVSEMLIDNQGSITTALGQTTQKVIQSDDDSPFSYFPDFFSIEEVKENAMDVIQRVNEEGIVLLKNNAKALPLNGDKKVNLYSSSSVQFITTGGGSSFAKKSTGEVISLKKGLEQAGLTVNNGLWNFYVNNPNYKNDFKSNTSSDAAEYKINDATWEQIDNSKNDPAEAGIFVLSRFGTEATDLKFTGATNRGYSNGDYLELSPAEKSVLLGMKALKDAGKLKKIVVLLNSVNQVELDFAFDDSYGIDSILWVGEGGSSAAYAIGNVLTGKVNPSGKLPDTYFKNHSYNPVYANFGDNVNMGSTIGGGTKSTKNVVYQEGIYNGYRYTETRYADVVTSRNNVGEFNYDNVVAYPFGYGLSYTSFKYEDFKVNYDEAKDIYTLSVKVTNNGGEKGKESVSFFISKPYTQYDITNGIEKPVVEFVGYAKTKLLNDTQNVVLTCEVDGSEFASYDSNKAKTYIVDEGDYYFTVASDAHVATNNVLLAQGISPSNLVGTGDANLVKSYHKNFDDVTYSVSKDTGKPITNQFDNADLNRYENRGTNSVKYISRNNWADTVKLGMTLTHSKLQNATPVTVNAEMVNDAKKLSDTISEDNIPYPTYGASSELNLASLLSKTDGKLNHVEYDDPRWEEILNKMTFDEQVMLLSNGQRKTYGVNSINKALTIDGNGALGPVGGQDNQYSADPNNSINRMAFVLDDPNQDSCPLQYPCSALVAAARNDEVAKELGNAIGEDCLWCGYSGLYGLGVNIHRGTYSGRAFEYYSEDGTLSGLAAAPEVLGIRGKGVYVYMKHAILNEQETNREGVNTWCNEQAIRELYLKPFGIAIRKGGAENVMTGFNRIGVVWTSQQGFINTVLRDEFNMMGFGVSDYWQAGYMDLVGGIMGGCALPDGDTAANASASALNKYKTGYGAVAWAMREETHRILYVVVNSNAMNGISASTQFINVTPPWLVVLGAVRTSIIVLTALSVGAYITFTVLSIVRKKEF